MQALGVLVLGPSYGSGVYWIEPQTINTQRYSGRRQVTGFDLEARPAPPNPDVVWTEGTLQLTLAFDTLRDLPKARAYQMEAEKLIHPSGALLHASNIGTVGGDTVSPAPAVAPTAWYILAAHRDNVFGLS